MLLRSVATAVKQPRDVKGNQFQLIIDNMSRRSLDEGRSRIDIEKMNAFVSSKEKIRAWMDTHFDEEGISTDDADDSRYYYKTPYLLTKVGLRSKGARVAKQVKERFIDSEGNLTGPPEFSLENRVYAMGWLGFGAMIVERFDLAGIMADRLIQMQDTESGGILLPDEDAGEAVAEVCFSAGAGMALAATGKNERAKLMADRFVTLLDAQPESGCYYNRFRGDGSIFARSAEGGWEKSYNLKLAEQRPANFATVVLALVWTGRALRDKSYFTAAQRYVDIVYSHEMDPAHFGRATKFGWAMLTLYEETGNPALFEHAKHLGDVLLSHQCDDGFWFSKPGHNEDEPAWMRLAYSADCAMTVCSLANMLK